VTADQDRRVALLAAYDSQLREQAEVEDADRWERVGPLLRAVFAQGAFGFVTYRSLGGLHGDHLDAAIAETVEFFDRETSVPRFEWKTRGHDEPADLGRRLRAAGLQPQPVETVMIGEASLLAVDVALPAGVVVRRLGDDADRDLVSDVEAALDMQAAVFGSAAGLTAQGQARLLQQHPDRVELWVAETRVGGEPVVVTAGRLERVPGTEFAGIWGGATLPEWRGRGIYRALTAARARSALTAGVRYLHSDSTELSRPILERAGMLAVTTTQPYVWTRAVTASPPPAGREPPAPLR
jgi:GNAT superfamily N-acetyltransferase